MLLIRIIGLIWLIGVCVPSSETSGVENFFDTPSSEIREFLLNLPLHLSEIIAELEQNETIGAIGSSECLKDFRHVFGGLKDRKMWAFRGKHYIPRKMNRTSHIRSVGQCARGIVESLAHFISLPSAIRYGRWYMIADE